MHGRLSRGVERASFVDFVVLPALFCHIVEVSPVRAAGVPIFLVLEFLSSVRRDVWPWVKAGASSAQQRR